MMPAGGMSVTSVPSSMTAPDTLGRNPITMDYERGGAAVGNSAMGLNSLNWRIQVVGNEVRLSPSPYTTETVLFSVAGITEASLGFDQTMRPAVAYVLNGVAKLWWYDTQAAAQVTTTLASDVRSPFLTLDDKRGSASASNDILMFYLREQSLYYRQQRDRFQTEYLVSAFDFAVARIARVGLSTGLRMGVEVERVSVKRGSV